MLAWSAKGLLCHEKLQLLSNFGLLSSVGIYKSDVKQHTSKLCHGTGY